MGAFLVAVAALLIAVMAALMPFASDSPLGGGYASGPSVQAVAANMIQYHLSAVSFVSIAANSGSSWTFTDSDQRTVRCSATYTSGTYAGTCPTNQFVPPTFFSVSTYAAGSLNIVNWKVHYDSASKKVITYATSSADVAGYTPAQVAAALADYSLANSYTGWYWGIMSGASPFTLSNGTATMALPATCAALGTAPCASGLLGIVTVIP